MDYSEADFYPDTLGLAEIADIGGLGVWGLCPQPAQRVLGQ